ncbi:hypothetical protein ACFVKB_45160 [Rhodococcus sp. NPDC127530]|uniref:hypothetical protein n=1 Tax=unclassified Rhodococcus (in: high G+C Gram-positive bacteria) TaxID=192944 RepID=UPI00363F84EC
MLVTPNADEVRALLDTLATKPWWRLNLDDDSIDVDGVTITDKTTGAAIVLSGGWGPIIGRAETLIEYQTNHNIFHIAVRGDAPPTVGSWRKWPSH